MSHPGATAMRHEHVDIDSSPSKRDKLKAFASKAKIKTKDVLSMPSSGVDRHIATDSDEDDLFSDAAFSPPQVVEHGAQRTDDDDKDPEGGLKLAKQLLLHPRKAVRQKATKTTASELSSIPKPHLSSGQQRDLLDAHGDLSRAESTAASANVSHSTDESTDTDVELARERVEKLEVHRESLKTAWAIERHVDRVRVVQRSMPMPLRVDYVSQEDTSQKKTDWARYLAQLTIYYTYGFTARYIDDFENPPFDIRDLTRTVERLAVVSGPWQTFFLDCRSIYKWESPKRTIKWATLFWSLWYTNHIVGYFYFWIIFSTIRNRYFSSSVSSIRDSVARGIDREKKAQEWTELVERHGGNDWMEPLLDDLGPMIQMQLGDLVSFLEVLSNFYNWERPRKTVDTLFVAVVLLLITLFCDMTFCVKLLWLNVGGAFFITFPIATNFPKYRKVVNLFHWFFWDVPSHADLGIMRLQEKAILMDAKSMDYSTADGLKPKQPKTQYTFRGYHEKSSGILIINRIGIRWHPKHPSSTSPSIDILFTHLLEMRKLEASEQSKKTKVLRRNTEDLQFIFGQSDSNPGTSTFSKFANSDIHSFTLNVKSKKRHEIFSLVLAWSGQRWQPLPIERHKDKKDQRDTFDKALKRAMP